MTKIGQIGWEMITRKRSKTMEDVTGWTGLSEENCREPDVCPALNKSKGQSSCPSIMHS